MKHYRICVPFMYNALTVVEADNVEEAVDKMRGMTVKEICGCDSIPVDRLVYDEDYLRPTVDVVKEV